MGDPLWTPSVDDVVAIHDDIVSFAPSQRGMHDCLIPEASNSQ